MKIHSFRFQNKALELKIEPIKFSNLSLLVGISGVGKTMILQSLLELKRIVNGKALNGIEWELIFSTNGNNDNTYLWQGCFETTEEIEFIDNGIVEENDDEVGVYRPKLEYEKLSKQEKDKALLNIVTYSQTKPENEHRYLATCKNYLAGKLFNNEFEKRKLKKAGRRKC